MSLLAFTSKLFRSRRTSRRRQELRRAVRQLTQIETLEDRRLLAVGAELLADINANGSDSSNPSQMVQVGDTVFFQANDGVHGAELWKSDGTEAGTALVKDINVGFGSSTPASLTSVGGTLYFTASNGLWKSDGTDAGTMPVTDITVGLGLGSSENLINIGETLYFRAYDGINGDELWKSDGTEAGTVLVKDIRPGTSNSGVANLTNVDGTLYFNADNGISGSELWKSDGTEAGTALVKDIRAGAGNSGVTNLTNVDGTLYFTANDGIHGNELWKSDGTEVGTVMVKDIYGGTADATPSQLTNVDGTLYFTANDGIHGNELWKSDGTEVGTALVKDLYGGFINSNPNFLTNVDGTLYFTALDSFSGFELWKSDGTAAGTVLVSDIRAGVSGSFPYYLTSVDGTLYFRANDGVSGNELWKSDGTEAGTVLVKDVRTGASGSEPNRLTNLDGTLFFTADDGIHGTEIWVLSAFEDGDGPSASVEDGAPNNGDGNLDGIPDSEQANVASLPSITGEYVTLASDAGDLRSVAVSATPPNASLPFGAQFPTGFLSYSIASLAAGQATAVDIFVPDGQVYNSYYKFGPTAQDTNPHWYSFAYDGQTGAEFFDDDSDGDTDRIVLHLVDGLRGDDDLVANGTIVDPGAPTFAPLIDLNGGDQIGNEFTTAFTEDGVPVLLQDIDLTLEGAASPAGPIGSEFQVNTYTANRQELLGWTGGRTVATDANGNFVVVWSGRGPDGSEYGVLGQRYDASGATVGGEFLVNTYTNNDQNFPSVAMDDAGNFVVAWTSTSQDGSGYGIYAQRYDASGNPLGGEFRVNTFTSSNQAYPTVAMTPTGAFVIAWSSQGQDGDGDGVYAQRYDASGVKLGGEFQVNSFTVGGQALPSVAMNATGEFIIAWESLDQDGSSYGIFAQRYDATGTASGGEFQVNTFTGDRQQAASVAMDGNGNALIAWTSLNQDGSGYGIYAQRFGPSGAAVGGEFQVNTFANSHQIYPSVAMNANGDTVVTWGSVQDGSGYGVYAQEYDVSGAAVGSEFQVNSYTTDSQDSPSVAMTGTGDYVVAWNSDGQDGSSLGVFAQRRQGGFHAAPNIDQASVVITNLLDGAHETLAANTAGTNITASYAAGVLLLSGSDTPFNYQQVLRSVTHYNASQNPTTTPRIIEFTYTRSTVTSPISTTSLAIVSVNDAPTISASENSIVVDEGSIAVNSGIFDDVDGTSTLSVDIGTVVDHGNGTWSWSFAALDGPSDSQLVTVTATDELGATATASFGLTVNNVAPTFHTIVVAPQVNENEPVSVSFSTIVVGTLDTHSILIDWGDGSTSTFPLNTPGSFSFGTSHTYTDDNPTASPADTYSIVVTVTDDDGSQASFSRDVIVNNVLPAFSAFSVTPEIDENGIATITGTFSDPGTLDTHTVVVNWGDGNSEAVPFQNATTVLMPVSDTVGRDDNLDGEYELLESDHFEAHKFELMPDRERRFAMEFDLSEFSATDTLQSSILSLYRVGGTPPGLATIEVFGYSGDGTVSADDMTAAYKIAGPFTDSAADLASIDLTSFLQSRIGAGATHAGIVLRSVVVERQTQLASANSSDPALRPKLHVQFANRHTFSTAHPFLDDNAADSYDVTVTVTDDDGGVATQTRPVVVSNVAPMLIALTITPEVDENGTVNVSFNGGDVGTLDTHTINIDWGDGSTNTYPFTTPGGFSFGTAHTYLDDNATDSYNVTLTLTDDDGGVTVETRQVTVNNVAPSLDSLSITPEIDENGIATITGTFSDPGTLDTHTVVVNWGDGNSEAVQFLNATTVLMPVSDTVGRDDNLDGEYELLESDHFEAHTFELMPGRERRFAMEFDLSEFSATDTLQSSILSLYRVGGTPPGLATIEVFGYSGDGTVSADDMTAAYKIAGPFTDSAADLASIDLTSFLQSRLDAGATHAGIVLRSVVVERQTQLASANNSDPALRPKLHVQFANRHTFTTAHPFLDDNAADSYDVTVTVTDDDGGVATQTRPVVVSNVAPTLSALTITPEIDENGTVNVSFNGGDAGTLDTHTINIDWGDGSTNTFPFTTPGGFSFGTAHTYLDDNATDSYNVTLTLTDDDGGVTVETRQVTVNNVAPSIAADLSLVAIGEGSTATSTGTFSDPGTNDTVLLSASEGQIVDYGNGTWGWSLPTTDGPSESRMITITATDDDGGTSSSTFDLLVNNVVPVITLAGPTSAIKNQQLAFVVSSLDASSQDQAQGVDYIVEFGDGLTIEVSRMPGNSSGFMVYHTYLTTGSYTIKATATDIDGGTSVHVAQTINVAAITSQDLQTSIDQAIASGGSEPTIEVLAVTETDLDSMINAIGNISLAADAPPVQLVMSLGNMQFSGKTISAPVGVTVTIVNGSLTGASPALTVNSGIVIAANVTFNNSTPASTILVNGGTLILRGSTVNETDGGDFAAIEVLGGTVDLGTDSDAGGNTLHVHGAGHAILNVTAQSISAVGNTFQIDGELAASGYQIEDLVNHALDSTGTGLVTWESGHIYVTHDSASVQRGVNAVPSSGTVHVQRDFDDAYDASDKLLTVAYEDGPTLIAQMNPFDPTQRELLILGTEQRDKIDIKKGDVEGAVNVKFKEKHLGKFTVKNEHGPTIDRIVVYGLGGDDDIKVHKDAGEIPTELYGGPGNDKLRGGEGDDYLSGGDGDDVLSGQAGRDIMIGGLGSDKIDGDDGDDILVGGVYIESENRAAIHSISREWSRTDLDYASRVDHLLGGGGLNEAYLLNATTVFDDNAKDKLRGKKGLDWFMSDSEDDKTDADLEELLTEIEFDFVSGN